MEIDINGERMHKHFDFLLLGGGPASVSAAETLRTEGAKGSILLVSEDVCAPYGHTYLSKQFLMGALPKEKLLTTTAASPHTKTRLILRWRLTPFRPI